MHSQSPPPTDTPDASSPGHRHLLTLVLSLSAISVVAKVLGFAEKVIVAHYFGTSHTADVYFAVVGLGLSLVFLFRELIYPSLLPVFTQAIAISPDSAGGLFRQCFLAAGGMLVVLGILVFAGAPYVVKILFPGFAGPQQELASFLLRSLLPGIACLALMTVTYTTLNARRQFRIAAVGEGGFKLLAVAFYLLLIPVCGVSSISVVFGVCGASALAFHLVFLRDSRYLLARQHSVNSDLFGKVLRLATPLLLGVLFSHASDLVDNLLASRLPTGQLSSLGYAKKIVDAVLLVGPVAFVTVMYPHLSALASSGRVLEFKSQLSKAVRIVLFITVPLSCILIQLRMPITQCLFQHGQFDLWSAVGTSKGLAIYALGLPILAMDGLIVHSFFALSNTRTPIIVGIACVIVNIVLAVLLSSQFQYLGIALALVLAKALKVVVLCALLSKRILGPMLRDMVPFAAKLATAILLLAVTVHNLAVPGPDTPSTYRLVLLHLGTPAVVGILVFAASAYFLKIQEAYAVASILRRKFTVRG